MSAARLLTIAAGVSLTSTLPGRASAYQTAEIRPRVSGVIKEIAFKEGSEVKAGDQLYQIDPATYEASLASAQADVQKAEANLQAARNKASRFSRRALKRRP